MVHLFTKWKVTHYFCGSSMSSHGHTSLYILVVRFSGMCTVNCCGGTDPSTGLASLLLRAENWVSGLNMFVRWATWLGTSKVRSMARWGVALHDSVDNALGLFTFKVPILKYPLPLSLHDGDDNLSNRCSRMEFVNKGGNLWGRGEGGGWVDIQTIWKLTRRKLLQFVPVRAIAVVEVVQITGTQGMANDIGWTVGPFNVSFVSQIARTSRQIGVTSPHLPNSAANDTVITSWRRVLFLDADTEIEKPAKVVEDGCRFHWDSNYLLIDDVTTTTLHHQSSSHPTIFFFWSLQSLSKVFYKIKKKHTQQKSSLIYRKQQYNISLISIVDDDW